MPLRSAEVALSSQTLSHLLCLQRNWASVCFPFHLLSAPHGLGSQKLKGILAEPLPKVRNSSTSKISQEPRSLFLSSSLHCFQVQLALEQCTNPSVHWKTLVTYSYKEPSTQTRFLCIQDSSSGDLTNFRWYELSHSVMSDSLQPHGQYYTRLLRPWDFPGKNTGVGCHALLQEIFLIQESNPPLLCLLHWQVGYFPVAPPGKPSTIVFIIGVKKKKFPVWVD